MTQQKLDRLVAGATGEDVRAIRQCGFGVAKQWIKEGKVAVK